MTPSQSKMRASSDRGGEAEAEATSEDVRGRGRRRRRRAAGRLEGGRWPKKLRRAVAAGAKEVGTRREVEAMPMGGIGDANGDQEMER